MRNLDVIENGLVAIEDGKIVAVGPSESLDRIINTGPRTATLDADGGTVTPGFVDPHTHLLFAGGREDEFYMRVAGASYMEIARRGGGIGRTVGISRAVRRDELLEIGRHHLDLMLRQGTTTVEIKSGYGLSTRSELEHLEIIRILGEERPGTVIATFLGAHATPPEYNGRRESYVDLVINEMLPEVARRRLAQYCDIFCEEGAFTVEESRRILIAAAKLGIDTKLHADELTRSGGTELAAEIDARSVDHVNFASEADLMNLRSGRTIAVLLPATPFFLLAPQYADGRKIIDAGIPVALATDYNPTSSISSMIFVMFLACLYMKFDPSEALAAATINAAHAIGRAGAVGSLEPGKQADLLVLGVKTHRNIPFYVGRDIVNAVVKNGRVVVKHGSEVLH